MTLMIYQDGGRKKMMKTNMIYLKTFEAFRSKADYDRWRKAAELTTIIVPVDGLDKYDIPDEIKKMMHDWKVIVKSPYSDSFYDSTEITWSHKPDGSYRVSDHWNFYTQDKLHCKTDIKVINNLNVSIGKYDKESGTYKIINSLPSNTHLTRLKTSSELAAYRKNPEVIEVKKKFKEKVLNGDIFCTLTKKGEEICKGLVKKYTGVELKVEDPNSHELIFNDNQLNKDKYKITLNDNGKEIEDPFDIDMVRVRNIKESNDLWEDIPQDRFYEHEKTEKYTEYEKSEISKLLSSRAVEYSFFAFDVSLLIIPTEPYNWYIIVQKREDEWFYASYENRSVKKYSLVITKCVRMDGFEGLLLWLDKYCEE